MPHKNKSFDERFLNAESKLSLKTKKFKRSIFSVYMGSFAISFAEQA
jgi:hypothetical protein